MGTLGSGLPELVSADEDIARFLTQSSHYNSLMAKPSAFLPNPKHRETSVSRHGADPLDRLWELGRLAAGNRNLHGAAILKAQIIRAAALEVLAAEPPPRHAAIRQWPWIENDPELQKAQQLSAAQDLARNSTLLLYRANPTS
ncbi:MAG: hypothetical protein ACXW3Z_15100 [Limisphaerales bacterium]